MGVRAFPISDLFFPRVLPPLSASAFMLPASLKGVTAQNVTTCFTRQTFSRVCVWGRRKHCKLPKGYKRMTLLLCLCSWKLTIAIFKLVNWIFFHILRWCWVIQLPTSYKIKHNLYASENWQAIHRALGLTLNNQDNWFRPKQLLSVLKWAAETSWTKWGF